jgi:hypothetical protein
MFPLAIDYATPSAFESERDRQFLGLTANRRRPVRFHARVAREIFPFRLALQALGEIGAPAVPTIVDALDARDVEILGPHKIRFDLSGSKDRELPLIIAMMPIPILK